MQAVEITARVHLDERRIDALQFEHVEIDGDDAMARLRRGGSPVEEHVEEHIEVRVRRHRTESFQLSCGGGMAAAWRYEVVDVRSLR